MTRMRAGADIAVSSLEMEMAMMRTLCGFLPFGSLMITLYMGLINAGCSQQDARDYYFENPQDIGSLNSSATITDVEGLAGNKSAFQFLARDSGDDIRCIMYYFETPNYHTISQGPPVVRRLFVFRNNHLEKICSLPPNKQFVETDREGRRMTRYEPVDPLGWIDAVLKKRDLRGTKHLVPAPQTDQIKPTRRARSDLPVWSPLGLSLTIMSAIGSLISEIQEAPKREPMRRRVAVASERYDPLKISIGITREKVEELFGEPIRCEQRSEYVLICVYGDPKIPQERFAGAFRVAIRYEHGKVAGAYCDEFFPTAWLPQE